MANQVLEHIFSLKEKVALVTGASGGMGRALAVGRAGAGAHGVLNGRNDKELGLVREEIDRNGWVSSVVRADLGDVLECRRLIDETVRVARRLDVLVNCAGMNRRRPIEE